MGDVSKSQEPPAPPQDDSDTPEQTPVVTTEPEKPRSDWSDPDVAEREIRKLRKENAAYRVKHNKYEADQAKILDDQKSAEQKAQDLAAAAEQRAEVAVKRAVRSEVKAMASDAFADPNDPADNLDLTKYVDDAGEIDTDAINADLKALLQKKPHWGKSPERRGPQPDRSQGSSANGRLPVDAQIAEARTKGDWKTVIHLENQKLIEQARK